MCIRLKKKKKETGNELMKRKENDQTVCVIEN